ncbi:HECT-type E3 ubiquitin transferase [Malassezia sp. CBS 17886]|nr:HECT-type E3 ubiquitin transferase [Malassezia sp. CBS 17886]
MSAFMAVPGAGLTDMMTGLRGDSPASDMQGVEALGGTGIPILGASGASGLPLPLSALRESHEQLDRTATPSDVGGKAALTEEETSANEAKLAQVYETFDFTPLWHRLSESLARLQGDPSSAQVLLPLIESLMVVSTHALGDEGRGAGGGAKAADEPAATAAGARVGTPEDAGAGKTVDEQADTTAGAGRDGGGEPKADDEHADTTVGAHAGTTEDARTSPAEERATPPAPQTPTPHSPHSSRRAATERAFLEFTEKHRRILNLMVRQNPSLMSGSFSLLVRNPKVLDFDNKRNYFSQQLHRGRREHYTPLSLTVRRQHVFYDSFQYFNRRTGPEIKHGKLTVRFHNEEGIDAGGVTREWFQVLSREMFNPDYALFQPCAADRTTYQPNRMSAVNDMHLSFFKFIGRVIGKAIYDGRLLDAYFTRSFYKHILGCAVDYKDLEAVDPEYYNSLEWMLHNDITDVLDLTFAVDDEAFGETRQVELKPGGAAIPVTEENKHDYVRLVTEQRLTNSIKSQFDAFLQGFSEIIPPSLVKIFSEQELELLISGLPDIDVDAWKNNTELQGYKSSDPMVQWWWRAVRSFDQTQKAKLLQFITGTSKVPLEGFAHLQGVQGTQRFNIHKAFGEHRLPVAHTCFNQLDLPEYPSYERLRSQLLLAMNEGSEGFGFA